MRSADQLNPVYQESPTDDLQQYEFKKQEWIDSLPKQEIPPDWYDKVVAWNSGMPCTLLDFLQSRDLVHLPGKNGALASPVKMPFEMDSLELQQTVLSRLDRTKEHIKSSGTLTASTPLVGGLSIDQLRGHVISKTAEGREIMDIHAVHIDMVESAIIAGKFTVNRKTLPK